MTILNAGDELLTLLAATRTLRTAKRAKNFTCSSSAEHNPYTCIDYPCDDLARDRRVPISAQQCAFQ